MQQVEITYNIEKKEFVNHRLKLAFLNLKSLIFLIVIASLCFTHLFITDNPKISEINWFNFIPLLIPLFIVGFTWYSLIKSYARNPEFKSTVQIKMDEERYFGKSKFSEGNLKLTLLNKVLIEGNMLDIYFNKIQFASIPLRYISKEKIIQIKSFLNAAQVKNNL